MMVRVMRRVIGLCQSLAKGSLRWAEFSPASTQQNGLKVNLPVDAEPAQSR
jgi:hypothetical protein